MRVSKTVWKTLLLASTIVALRCLIPVEAQPSSIPSSYSWSGLRTDTVRVSYSYSQSIWYGGTGYLQIKANGPGVYSDTKTTTATVTVPEGGEANVYVCGDDRNPVPNGWTVQEKRLTVYVDGVKVYGLGKEYWWARCYSKAATLSPGTHRVELTISITVNVASNAYLECSIAYASMDIKVEAAGTVRVEAHRAQAALNGEATHFFTFRLPEASGVRSVNWKAVWNSVEKTGSGPAGSVQEAFFRGVNRDSWVFASPVVVRKGGSTPRVEPVEEYGVDSVYSEGAGEVGVRRIAVAVSNGDEVGFTLGKYLVTSIEYLGLNISGCTSVEGLDAWADSNSNVNWSQKIRFYSAEGWVVEEAAGGVETGFCVLKKIGGGTVSRRVSFSSRNRVDELTLTINIPQLRLRFDSMMIEPLGPTNLGLRMLGETVELRVKVSDCLGEYSRIEVYRVSESSPGVREYSFKPPTGVYRGITSTTGGNVTFKVVWSSYELTVKNVSGGVLRSGVYWARSGSTVRITVSARFSHDNSPAAGVRIMDSNGYEALTRLNGEAEFSYTGRDCEASLTYVIVDGNGNRLSREACVKIVFTEIRLEVSGVDGLLYGGSYYACNNALSSVSVKAVYSHSFKPVAGALVEFKPSGSSASTGVDGTAVLRLTGRNRVYEGKIEASDGFIAGEAGFRIFFTGILLEASRMLVSGRPGEEVEVTVSARLSFNSTPLNGLEVRWVETGLSGKTPASFRLRIPDQGFSKASFDAAGFLPCVEPCVVTLVSSGMRFSDPDNTRPVINVNKILMGPVIIVNNIPLENYSFRIMLNIMDLLNITIPRVVWHNNGSVAHGVRIGVVSSNGTVVRSSLVSNTGVSFSWTESKPGVYRYFVRALEEDVYSDVLSIEAVFTAFNITADYILDLNGTRVFYATARWAHNGSPVSSLPVYTSLTGKRTLSDGEGRIRLALNDHEYNASCVERILVFKRDPHSSGIWRTVGDCSIRIVRLDWGSLALKGDQYGFEALLSLEAGDGSISLPLRTMVEGYPPEIFSSIRVLRVKSDNSSMTVFISPSGGFSFRERLALRIDYAEYDGSRIKVRVRSLAEKLVVRSVRVKAADTGVEKTLGDLQPGSCLEASLELPPGLGANPVVIVAYSENTVPHAVRVWRKSQADLFPLISVTPLLAALVLRIKKMGRTGRGAGGVKQDSREKPSC